MEIPAPLAANPQIGWWEKLLSFFELSLPTMGAFLPVYAVLMALNFLACWPRLSAGGMIETWVFLSCNLFMTVAVGVYALSPFVAMRLPWRYCWTSCGSRCISSGKCWSRSSGRPKEWVRTSRESQSRADILT